MERTPEANPCIVYRFLAWRIDGLPIGFQLQGAKLRSIVPEGSYAKHIHDERKHFPSARFPQIGDHMLGIIYRNNKTLTRKIGEIYTALGSECRVSNGPVVAWYAHDDTVQHIQTHRITPTIPPPTPLGDAHSPASLPGLLSLKSLEPRSPIQAVAPPSGFRATARASSQF